MATVHVGANADPHRASLWRAPPEGWLVPAERRQASTTPYVLTQRVGRLRVAVTPIRDGRTVPAVSRWGCWLRSCGPVVRMAAAPHTSFHRLYSQSDIRARPSPTAASETAGTGTQSVGGVRSGRHDRRGCRPRGRSAQLQSRGRGKAELKWRAVERRVESIGAGQLSSMTRSTHTTTCSPVRTGSAGNVFWLGSSTNIANEAASSR